ncbi:Squalene/phytoene synthase-domain-containing protein [Pilobolus umbonatus]|nr:Squalene/phytoene synthase-domain-containing protein [Pilobolus umbonatus]
MRHGLSLLIASLAILSQSQIHLFMLAVLSFFWFIAGPYFIRRWKTVIPTMTAITLIGHLSCYFDFNHTTLGSFHFTEWFLLTCIITLACNTFDYLDAILNMYPFLVIPEKRNQAGIQNPISIKYWVAILTLLINMPSELDLPVGPIEDLQTAIRSLGPASRSWKVMAALFPTNLRQDLCLLYSFFRTADDLIDDASTMEIGKQNLFIIRQFLKDVFFGGSKDTADHKFIVSTDLSLPFHLDWNYYATVLPNSDVLAIFRNFSRISHYLCPRAMFELTDAWEADLLGEPLKEQKDLLNYAALISGTFGELCTCAMMYKLGRGNWNGKDSICRNENVLSKARATGQCLQLVNIARDIIADSLVGRCYVPLQYSSSEIYYKLKVLKSPLELGELKLKSYSLRILALADRISDKAQKGIDGLPEEVQDSVRAAFEIYMRIGPTLINDPKFPLRAKVPKREQQWIAMRCLYGFRGSVVQALKNTYRQFGSVVIRAFHIILLN